MYRGNFSFGNFFHPSSCCILKSQISEGRKIQYFFHVEFNLHLALYEGKINFFSKLLNFSSFLASFNGRFFSLRYYQMNLASLYTFFCLALIFFCPTIHSLLEHLKNKMKKEKVERERFIELMKHHRRAKDYVYTMGDEHEWNYCYAELCIIVFKHSPNKQTNIDKKPIKLFIFCVFTPPLSHPTRFLFISISLFSSSTITFTVDLFSFNWMCENKFLFCCHHVTLLFNNPGAKFSFWKYADFMHQIFQ